MPRDGDAAGPADAPPLPELVPCPPMRSRLTAAGCVRMWRSTQERPPLAHEARAACLTCPLGPERAGVDAATAVAAAKAAALSKVMAKTCPRCERPTPRLIGGRTCVSCYNRTREAVIGRNAKGTAPRKIMAVIHAEALALGNRVILVEHVVSRAEAVAIAARHAGPGTVIGVPPLRLVEPEQRPRLQHEPQTEAA